jgi:polyisoprenoid-binding protein YceI
VKPLLSLIVLAGGALFGSTYARAAEAYLIDPAHSTVSFSIRHFVGKVEGRFTSFGGRLLVDRTHLERSSVEASIQVRSIETNSTKRDAHLRSADFLDSAQYPTITFVSRSWQGTGAGTFEVSGDLTIKDVTRRTALKVTLLGFGADESGAHVSRWEGITTLNKADFHVKDPPLLDATIGDEVTVTFRVKAVQTKD